MAFHEGGVDANEAALGVFGVKEGVWERVEEFHDGLGSWKQRKEGGLEREGIFGWHGQNVLKWIQRVQDGEGGAD